MLKVLPNSLISSFSNLGILSEKFDIYRGGGGGITVLFKFWLDVRFVWSPCVEFDDVWP